MTFCGNDIHRKKWTANMYAAEELWSLWLTDVFITGHRLNKNSIQNTKCRKIIWKAKRSEWGMGRKIKIITEYRQTGGDGDWNEMVGWGCVCHILLQTTSDGRRVWSTRRHSRWLRVAARCRTSCRRSAPSLLWEAATLASSVSVPTFRRRSGRRGFPCATSYRSLPEECTPSVSTPKEGYTLSSFDCVDRSID